MTLIRYDTQAGAGGEKRQAHTSVSMRDKSYERGNSSNEDGNNEIGRGGGGGAEQQSDAVTSLQELAAIERVAVAAAAADTTTTTHSLTVMSSRDKLGAAKGRRISALAKAIATRRSAKKKKKMSMSNATASELYTKLVLVLTVTFFLAFFVVIAVSIHISSSIDEKIFESLHKKSGCLGNCTASNSTASHVSRISPIEITVSSDQGNKILIKNRQTVASMPSPPLRLPIGAWLGQKKRDIHT